MSSEGRCATTRAGGGRRVALARAAGGSLVSMAVVATFAVASTQGLVIDSDAAGTAANIASHETLFRAGLFAWLLVAVLDVAVAIALCLVFAPVSRSVAILAGAARIVYASILVIGLGGLFDALHLSRPGSAGTGSQVMLSLAHFQHVWTAGLVLFGVHLALLAYLVRTSRLAPRAIEAMLWLASSGYVVGEMANIVVPAIGAALAPILAAPEAVGELAFAAWLIARAKRFSDAPAKADDVAPTSRG